MHEIVNQLTPETDPATYTTATAARLAKLSTADPAAYDQLTSLQPFRFDEARMSEELDYYDEEHPAPTRGSYVVAVYHCQQRYGGPEEGGWWYDTGNLTRIVDTFRTDQTAHEYSRRLNNRLRSRKFGPNLGKREYTSSISTGEYRAQTFEDTAPSYFPESKPRYA